MLHKMLVPKQSQFKKGTTQRRHHACKEEEKKKYKSKKMNISGDIIKLNNIKYIFSSSLIHYSLHIHIFQVCRGTG